jgi:adenylate cyclase
MIKQLWSRYLNIGVGADLRLNETRYVRASNGIVVIVSLLLLLQLPGLIFLLPASKYLLVSFIAFPIMWLFVPFLNQRHYHTTARLFFSFSCIILITISAVQIGRESDNHLFMISVFLGAFIIYPPTQMKYIVMITIISGLAMVGLELYFIEHQSVLDAPPEFFSTGRILSITALFLIILFISVHHYKIIESTELQLEREHQKSERLLLNILPASIAKRLKSNTEIIADRFDSATVLFADISGFTRLSSSITPEKLVAILNFLFSKFDEISQRYGLEKIKTIGDSYMLTGGIPVKRDDHCEAVADCALEILNFMKSASYPGSETLSMRIGIHTGPVVAGVIGQKKLSYDLWGDTVNVASRMESHGLPDKIQVTKEVYELLKDKFLFTSRGKIEIKGKGEMDTYFLEGKMHP